MNIVSKELIERGFTKKTIKHDYTTKDKTCSKCKQQFPRTNEYFRKESKTKDKLSYICKTCSAAVCKASRIKHADRLKQYQKSPEFVYSQIKCQAKKRNITFTLSKEDYLEFLAYKPCYYCGSDNTKHWVDRNINDHMIGYTLENSVPCCELCNKMKSAHSEEVFINHCKQVSKFNA